MINSVLRGTGVAIVTPFNKNLTVDYKSLTKLVEHIIKGKVEYVVVLGTTGETVNLSKEEKRDIVKHVVSVVAGRVPIVLGMGGNNTQDILNACKDKENFKGISAMLSVSPYYNKPNQRGIYAHYKAIAAVCPVPIILYNVPGRTASNVSAETTLRLSKECSNIIGMKEASGDFSQCMKIIKHKPKDFLLISGDDLLALPLIASGADGVISVVANAYPSDFSEMVRLIMDGNVSAAQKLHYKLTDIIEQLFADGNPAGIKAVLELMNVMKGYLRLPLVNVNPETQKALEKLVLKYK
jgi:4-hydroxy-tetrahydrodipicolinate synthase